MVLEAGRVPEHAADTADLVGFAARVDRHPAPRTIRVHPAVLGTAEGSVRRGETDRAVPIGDRVSTHRTPSPDLRFRGRNATHVGATSSPPATGPRLSQRASPEQTQC